MMTGKAWLPLVLLCWSVLAHPVRAVDGDTFDALVDVWLGFGSRVVQFPERVRVLGVDTPERGQPGYEDALLFARQWLAKGDVNLRVCGRDFNGRILSPATRGDEDLATLLQANGLTKAKGTR